MNAVDLPRDSFGAARVTPNLWHAFGGVWRLTARRFFNLNHWLAVAAMLGALCLFAIAASSRVSGDGRYLHWAALFYVCFLVPILAFISGGAVVRDDLKSPAADYLFTRPIPRPAYVVFRFLSHVACAQIDFLFGLALVAAVGAATDVAGLTAAIPVLLLGQALVVIVFSALGFFGAALTSRYVIIGLVYGAIVEVGVGSIPTQLNRVSMLRRVTEIMHPILADARIGMGGPQLAAPLSTPAAIALLLALATAMVAVTALVFHLREMTGTAGRET